MLVGEILALKGKVLFTIAPNRSIAEAVEIMNEQDVGSLVVFSRGAMVGMLTFRQVLQAVQKGIHEELAGQYERFLVRKQHLLARTRRGQGRTQPGRADDGRHDHVHRLGRRNVLERGLAAQHRGAAAGRLQGAGERVCRSVLPHHRVLRRKLQAQLEQLFVLAMGAERKDLEAIEVTRDDVERALPDRAGGAQDGQAPGGGFSHV